MQHTSKTIATHWQRTRLDLKLNLQLDEEAPEDEDSDVEEYHAVDITH